MKKVLSVRKMKALDLLPFPYTLPYTNLPKFCVAFTLFPRIRDLPVLENIASLMGMKVEFSEEKTTHLIYQSYSGESEATQKMSKEDYLKTSSKIQTIHRTFKDKSKIKVVDFEWFLNCILNREAEDEKMYSTDLTKLFAK